MISIDLTYEAKEILVDLSQYKPNRYEWTTIESRSYDLLFKILKERENEII